MSVKKTEDLKSDLNAEGKVVKDLIEDIQQGLGDKCDVIDNAVATITKRWNEEFDQKVTRNGDFFVSKIQRPENKLICTQNFTVRSISHSLEKKSNSSCDYKTCRQVSFSKEGEEKCSKIDCKCKCHTHSRYI